MMFKVPREPSSPRIAIWRRLKALGVAQVADGVVALPADARTREQLEWVAQQVAEAGGESTLWLGRMSSARHERALAARMAQSVAEAYRAVITEAESAVGEPASARTIGRLRRELHRISARDFFPPPERDEARARVEALANPMAVAR